MFETLDKMMSAGFGALTMTREKAEQLFDDAVKRGRQQRGDQKKFVDDVMDSATRARNNLEEMIDKQIRSTLASLNLPSREDLARVEAKLDALLECCPESTVAGAKND
ncbi:MAG: phasin family protein [Phycisphaerae bacterium]|nr:phasin family protein [Phycisphaerae bacterium]